MIQAGDRVIDISEFRSLRNPFGIITSIAPDGALFGKFDDGDIMWRYRQDMVKCIPQPEQAEMFAEQ